jgi:hypothetical protein
LADDEESDDEDDDDEGKPWVVTLEDITLAPFNPFDKLLSIKFEAVPASVIPAADS